MTLYHTILPQMQRFFQEWEYKPRPILSLSIAVLDAETAPRIVPFDDAGGAGYPATAALQAARILYQDLSRFFAYGIESCRAYGEAQLDCAFSADLLFNDNMGLLIVLKDIDAELRSRVHYILLSIKRSLRAARLSNPSFAPFHTAEEIRFLGPSPIQKISSKVLQTHWG